MVCEDMPWRTVLILFLSQLSQSCAVSTMIGYLPPLIHRFGVNWVDVGIYKGVALSLSSGGYVASTLVAGFLIDYIGSIKFFIACTLLQALVVLFTAFVYDMPSLYAASLFIGLVSCNRIAAKVISVQISHESIVSKVINYGVSVPFQIGLLLGPSLGGFLVLPAEQYSKLFSKGSLLDMFPIMLSNLLISLFLVFTVFLSFYYLPTQDLWYKESPETNQLLENSIEMTNEAEDSLTIDSNTTQQANFSNNDKCYERLDRLSSAKKWCTIAGSRNAFMIMLLCFICGLVGDPTLNVYSLWMYTPKYDGGMGYSPLKYATFKFYASPIVLLMDLFLPILLLQILSKRHSLIGSYLVLVLSIGISWIPSRLSNESFTFALSLITFVVCRVPISVINVTQLILLKNIFPRDTHGRALGVATCLGGAGRLVGYMITGVSFAWSLSNLQRNPTNSYALLNEGFTFQLLALFSLCGACTTMILTDEAEHSLTNNN